MCNLWLNLYCMLRASIYVVVQGFLSLVGCLVVLIVVSLCGSRSCLTFGGELLFKLVTSPLLLSTWGFYLGECSRVGYTFPIE
jgi:hypothetical protein